jgi:polysaccharide export outer membrane protein
MNSIAFPSKRIFLVPLLWALGSGTAVAQTPAATEALAPRPAERAAETAVGVPLPSDYVIGPDDVLTVVFWREKELSSEVTVRPDGRISIPVLQDIDASGLTPEELRDALTTRARRYIEDPNVTVIVKEINSRRVYITGQVAKPGPYALTVPINVVQLISMAGGLLEYAHEDRIVVMRTVNGVPTGYYFNYKAFSERKNLKQNISLKPGDTVIVP